MKKRTMIVFVCALALAALSCGGTKISPPASPTNPAPTARFSEFKTLDVKKVVIAPEFAAADANQRAAAKIQENIDINLNNLLTGWNGTDRGATRGTLVIEPMITKIKFIGGGARVMAGAMAGNSAVLLEMTCKDAETGQEIAKPVFYQRANAMAGSYSIGVADNMMLTRVGEMVANYIKTNFENAVGGPTGSGQ